MCSAKYNWKLTQRKMSEADKNRRESQKFQEKQHELGQYRYDKTLKGWRGPTSTALKAVSKMKKGSAADQNWDNLLSRLRNNRESQKQQMQKVPQQFVKKAVADAPNPDLDKEEEDDVASISEDPVHEKPDIKHPFKTDYSLIPNWEKPRSGENDISKKEGLFQFQKPEGGDPVCYTSSHQQVQRLSKEVDERDKIIQNLRQELIKAHKEAAKLSNELSRYSGADYEELKKENGMLRSTLSRMTRDNMRLHGEVRANTNSVIIKQRIAEEYEKKFGAHSRRPEMPTTPGSRGFRSAGANSASARYRGPDSPSGSDRSGPAGPSHPRALPRRQRSWQQQQAALAAA